MDIKKKIVALFACFALCASFVPVLAIADLTDENAIDAENDIVMTTQAASTTQLSVSFQNGYAPSQGNVQYSLDDGTTWETVSSDSNFTFNSVTGNNLRLKIVPADGYSIDWTGITYQEDDGAAVNLASDTTGVAGGLSGSNGYFVSASATRATLSNVEFRSDNGGGNGGGQTNATGTFTYSYTGEGADIRVGDGQNMRDLPPGALTNQRFDYYCEGDTVTFQVGVFFITKLTSITVNGVNYTANFPTTDAEKVAAFEGQHTWATFTVPKADSYTISTMSASEDSPAVGNFLWSYMDRDVGTDDYLDHGTIEFLSFAYNGRTYSQSDMRDRTAFSWSQDEDEGGSTLPAGGTLTVRLVPEYGYQLSEFTINGGQFSAGSEVSTFSFVVPRGNFHLGAHFTQVSDAVASTNDSVTGGTVGLGEGLIDSGSALLSVQSLTPSTAETAAFTTAADTGFTVASYLDLSLNQVVYKGTNSATDAWTAPLGANEEFDEPVTVSLQLADGVVAVGSTVEVLHERHDGTVEVIPATYDAATRTVTFQTDSFSDYAIATKGGASSAATSKTTLAKTGDPLTAGGVVVVSLTALGVVALASRKLCA